MSEQSHYLRGSRRQFLTGVGAGIGLAPSAMAGGQGPASTAAGQESLPLTLFAFDDVSIPYRENLYLTMCPAEKHAGNPVLRYGSPGEPDEFAAKFYGSIIRHEGRFKMWYPAADREITKYAEWQKLRGDRSRTKGYYGWRLAYAESEDGIHWKKPDLGLVEYNGSRNNNLLQVDPPEIAGIHLIVLHEPEDRDPAARFKMLVSAAWAKGHTSVPLISADGLRWRTPRKIQPVQYQIQPAEFFFPQEHFEQAGLYKWQGLYYVTGQQISPWVWLPDGQPCGRVMTLFHSRDFSRWPAAKTLAFVPDGYKPAAQGLGEEAHMPASVWNRGKILLGLYGQWHGAPRAEDRSVDLGFLISNDGLHFREPQPGFHFLRPGPKGAWDSRALLQGQGFEHIGEKTYIWYGSSNLFAQTDEEARNQIGLATMRRDGFGFIAVKRPEATASLVTVPLRLAPGARISVNADGLSTEAQLLLELLDETGAELPAYSGGNAAVLERSGVNENIAWKLGRKLPVAPVRIRVKFDGKRRDAIRLYAVYAA